MAREKTQSDVDIARIKADLELAKEKIRADVEQTKIRWGGIRAIAVWLCLTVMLGIVAWAAIRVFDKPAWLTLALALIGGNASQAAVIWRLQLRIKRMIMHEQASPGPQSTTIVVAEREDEP